MNELYEDGWKRSKYMIEHPDEILNSNNFPCDNCDHLNCGYCDLDEKWKELHPTNNKEENFNWD